jgi:hypothetical protein
MYKGHCLCNDLFYCIIQTQNKYYSTQNKYYSIIYLFNEKLILLLQKLKTK